MSISLAPLELRVIGCLIEKSLTTPDQYPLTINALKNACNQKSNRDPVVTLSECEVQETVDALIEKRLLLRQSGSSSRVPKYWHRFCNTEFSDLQFSAQELGIICVLFLRGPQTPGELRSRTNRLCNFANVQETEAVLNEMTGSESSAYVVKLAREPGRRESRYVHLFGLEVEKGSIEEGVPLNESRAGDEEKDVGDYQMKENDFTQQDKLKALEEKVEFMQLEIDELRKQLAEVIN